MMPVWMVYSSIIIIIMMMIIIIIIIITRRSLRGLNGEYGPHHRTEGLDSCRRFAAFVHRFEFNQNPFINDQDLPF
jgi:hypothetical protein